MKSKVRIWGSVAVIAVASLVAYWYWSPFLAIRSMQSAAQRNDADAFNQYVDYPKLRESLKGQFSAIFTGAMDKSKPAGDDVFGQMGANLGMMLGVAFVDRFVEAMVRPEVVMREMAEAKLKEPAAVPRAAATSPSSAASATPSKKDVRWDFERKGVDRVIARGLAPDGKPDSAISFVFDRTGFAHWQLTEVRLPPMK